ncbi:hypothetical protein CFC21_059568 [Triticum aestivum]|uniref:NB-ARC domain-containing protein n=2 Tax=Triticum aestivum TaxID=4565 RepID=A0A3B6IW16_WHEAT|nr:disease resistance protein Pik-2-like [Triticum aestivum]KAF7051321.1 hypothetical protein CFC21_059568 [Triticum aestivum]
MAEASRRAGGSSSGDISPAVCTDTQPPLAAGVQRDANFIKDEMEVMNGFLRHLARTQQLAPSAGHPDDEDNDEVQAWARQVRDLAGDSRDCINLYRHTGPRRAKGLLRYVRMPWFLGGCATIPRSRSTIAKHIRELKVRVQEAGERRLRYGIAVPPPPPAITQTSTTMAMVSRWPPLRNVQESKDHEDDDDERGAFRRALIDAEPNILEEGAAELITWLGKKGDGDEAGGRPLRLTVILAPDDAEGTGLAQQVYQDPSVSGGFDINVWITIQRPPILWQIFHDLLCKLLPDQNQDVLDDTSSDNMKLLWSIRGRLEGRRVLIVLDDLDDYPGMWDQIRIALNFISLPVGSAIMVTTKDDGLVKSSSPDKVVTYSLVDFFSKRAVALVASNFQDGDVRGTIRGILKRCDPDVASMKMFLHTLYGNPNRTKQELEKLQESLCSEADHNDSSYNFKQMVMFSYSDMPRECQLCFLHLCLLLPQDHSIRRTSLVRRWAAQGLISAEGGHGSAEAAAERCFSAFVSRGLICPADIGDAGKIKTCVVPPAVHRLITEVAEEENVVRVGSTICNAHLGDIKRCLGSLPVSSQLLLLKVLDLEGCKGLERRHLNNICKLFMLKYLSLRNTDVSALPKQIHRLQQLETLDIRQTKIQAFPTDFAKLLMLKHLLAGRTDFSSPVKDTINSKESFSTPRMPQGIGAMRRNLEILSHVQVSGSGSESMLMDVGQLVKVQKLGVVLHGKKVGNSFKHLLQAISKLNGCLRSLSIRIGHPGDVTDPLTFSMDQENPFSPPEFLQSLYISGLTGVGLPPWITELHQLGKITLRDTSLMDHDIRLLGELGGLRCLRLRHMSYAEMKITFGKGGFPSLKCLIIEGSDITNIIFESGAAPGLEKIAWGFKSMQFISGIGHLPRLKELELSGSCNPDPVKQAVAAHPSHPVFKHNA